MNRDQRIIGDTFTLEQYMDRMIAQRRFNMALLALFGVLGLVIAAVGIYGVMAYIVAQRTNEIGVRMALGATRGNVVAMVLRRAGVMLAAGLGSTVEIETDGSDERAAMDALLALINDKFGEGE